MAQIELSYEDVLEYLDDRRGERVTVSAYPTFHEPETGEGEPTSPLTLLGLSLTVTNGGIEAVKSYESEAWLEGRVGTRIRLLTGDWGGSDDGLVLTREWFTGAVLDENLANLRVFVFANTGAEPFFPPVGKERDPDERSPVYLHNLVGWGFAFEFEDPPIKGRWAVDDEEEE